MPPDRHSAEFESHRSRLFGIAYRMLGSASEAEDAVQDAWLRYAAADRSNVRSHEAFLTTIITVMLAFGHGASAQTVAATTTNAAAEANPGAALDAYADRLDEGVRLMGGAEEK